MNRLISYLEMGFNNQREQWEKSLKAELKLEDVTKKTVKKSPEGIWSTLLLESPKKIELSSTESWKKAAQTYVRPTTDLFSSLQDDLDHGVRVFFFHQENLKFTQYAEIDAFFKKIDKPEEIKIFFLNGDKEIVSGREVHDAGGNIIQELAKLTIDLISKENLSDEIPVGVFVDSNFFNNIAKIRAARLLTQKVLDEQKINSTIKIVALTSYREWTLYERYSNVLRNVGGVASALIGGADFIQSSGYQSIFDIETEGAQDSEHTERSLRLARNTSHILSLESMLGVVSDPSFGSYHLESLTQNYAKEAWEMMQKVFPLAPKDQKQFFSKEATSVRDQRILDIKTRKHVLAGMNDYPDVNEELNLESEPLNRTFRLSHTFEELRFKMEKVKKKPEVYISVFGDYSLLSGRINFVKNYFELLGLKVTDSGQSQNEIEELKKDLSSRREQIIVFCCVDEEYPNFTTVSVNAKEKFIAGKFEKVGFQNIYAGQNIYDVLSGLVNRWGQK